MTPEQYEKWRRADAFDRAIEAVSRLSWLEKSIYSLILWTGIFWIFGAFS